MTSDTESAVVLKPLATVRVTRGEVHRMGPTPFGRRVIAGIARGRWEGDRIRGEIIGAGGDWAIPGDEQVMMLDVRQLVRTHDGALIYVAYTGRADRERGTYTVAPTFETDDKRYAWLNLVQAIGQGRTEGEDIVYRMFEVR